MKTQVIICDFCLKELAAMNIKKFNNIVNKELMNKHKPSCPNWNELAAKVMKL